LAITGIDGKNTKCCGLSAIKDDDRVNTCCGSGKIGKKFDKRFQSCCTGRYFAELFSAVTGACCKSEIIDIRINKCVKNTETGIIKKGRVFK